jgi:hypothetical protein
MRAYDRVSLMFDVDRDYNTCFHFQGGRPRLCRRRLIRGGTRPAIRNGLSRYIVKPKVGHVELADTTASARRRSLIAGASVGHERRAHLPARRGLRQWDLPAEAPETAIRPEGIGLLLFTGNDRAEASRK